MIPDIVPVNTWAGNDSTTTFDFDFLINSESELKVLHTDKNEYQTTLRLNIDYSINQVGNKNGSFINFPLVGSEYSTLKDDEKITLMLDIPIAQTMPFGTSAVLNLNSLEIALDYIVRLIQIVDRKTERSVKVMEGSDKTPDEFLESLEESEANALLYSQNAANSAGLSNEYAQQSQSFANVSEQQAVIATEKTEEVIEAGENALNSIEAARINSLTDIEDARQNSITDITNVAQSGVSEIATLKDASIEELSQLSDTSNNELITLYNNSYNSIQNETDDGVNRIQQTSNALNQTQVTNCLLEVSQNIKLELTDGVLTLKAGSKVIVPYGTEDLSATYPIGSTFFSDNFKIVDNEWNGSKFTIWVELQTDITGGYTGYTFTGSAVVNFTASTITIDGTTIDPDATGNFIYYNADEYKVTHAGTTGDTTRVFSLPIGIVDMDSTIGVNAIKQVFNGFGYVGSTWWVDKGVKGLVPNGRNADGSLKNIEKTTEKITIVTAGTGSITYFICINFEGAARNAKNTTHYEQNEKPTFSETYGSWYNPEENKIYFYNNGVLVEVQFAMVGEIITSDGVVQSITTKKPFRAVDYDDALLKSNLVEIDEAFENIAEILTPDTSSIISVSSLPYTAPTYGWWVHYGVNQTGSVALNGVTIDLYSYAANNWPGHQSVQILLRPGDVITLASGSAPTTKMFMPCRGVK